MKKLAKLIKTPFVKRLVNGIIDSTPVISTVKANMRAEEGGVGKIHWQRLIISLLSLLITGSITVYLVVQVVKGIISVDQMIEILKVI